MAGQLLRLFDNVSFFWALAGTKQPTNKNLRRLAAAISHLGLDRLEIAVTPLIFGRRAALFRDSSQRKEVIAAEWKHDAIIVVLLPLRWKISAVTETSFTPSARQLSC